MRCEAHTRTQLTREGGPLPGDDLMSFIHCPGTAEHTVVFTLPVVVGVSPLYFPVKICDSCLSAWTGWH